MASGESKDGIGAKMKRLLGLEGDQARDRRQLTAKLQENQAAKDKLVDQRAELIDEMERVRARYKLKKTQHDKTVGPAKTALAREAKQILLELQQLQKRDDIIESAMRRHSEVIRKIQETLGLMEAATTASADDLEDVDLIHEEYIEEAKLADDVMRDVAGREYELADQGPSLEELEASLGLTEDEPLATEAPAVEAAEELPDLDEVAPPKKQPAAPETEKPAKEVNEE